MGFGLTILFWERVIIGCLGGEDGGTGAVAGEDALGASELGAGGSTRGGTELEMGGDATGGGGSMVVSGISWVRGREG